MPNWCNTSVVFEGDADEINALYETMQALENQKEPAIPNGFGNTWLGLLVNELGEDWQKVRCRGSWFEVHRDSYYVLRFETETAWDPMLGVFDLICQKYPSLHYYFQSDEPGMCEYLTNDELGKYFPDRYILEICMPDGEGESDTFSSMAELYKAVSEETGMPINDMQDIQKLDEKLTEASEDCYCYVYEYKLV